MVIRYLDEQCRTIFGGDYFRNLPSIPKIWSTDADIADSRYGDTVGLLLGKKGVITLNKRLLEVPRNCIEYVVIERREEGNFADTQRTERCPDDRQYPVDHQYSNVK